MSELGASHVGLVLAKCLGKFYHASQAGLLLHSSHYDLFLGRQ